MRGEEGSRFVFFREKLEREFLERGV
jgi:hypothetical protein